MQEQTIKQPAGRFALTNGRVILPHAVVEDMAVVVEGGTIAGIAEVGALGSDLAQIDVGGRYVAPGLIDIHVHGARGRTFNEPDAAAFGAIAETLAARGITSALATLATAAVDNLVRCLDLSREWMGVPRGGAQILGVHLEGPYFSMEQRGAQDPKHLRTPDDGTVERLLEYHDAIRIMTFAPELPGALDLTARVAALGVVPAAGHSSARDVDLAAAVAAGLRHIIHLWSGQSSTVREGAWRRPGLLEASLVMDGLTAEMIADNKHLPPTLMKLAYKCLGPDRLCAISDATSGAGLPQGTRFQMGEMEYEVDDGVGMTLDRTAFAGSTTLLNEMVPILHTAAEIPLPEAVRMTSLTPARVIGVQSRKGSLEAGKDADIAIFEDDFSAWRTLIGGRWVYNSST
jgi:N-acetylglucosamine-6-phosphate deacetylase